MTRQEWIKFFSERINQMEAFAPAGGRIVLNVKQAKDLLQLIESFEEKNTTIWVDNQVDANDINYELCDACKTWSIGKDKKFCPNCGNWVDFEK